MCTCDWMRYQLGGVSCWACEQGARILTRVCGVRQVDDASNLEYQAGQEDEQAGDEPQNGEPDKKKPDPEKQQQAADGEQEEQAEEDGLEGDEQDGGVNEDTADKHEDRQFAQPEVCTSAHCGEAGIPPQTWPSRATCHHMTRVSGARARCAALV